MNKKMNRYEEYKLKWMIDHGHSLEELINKMGELASEEFTSIEHSGTEHDYHNLIRRAFELLEKEYGFNGSEIWVSENEWYDNEAYEAYI